MTGLNIGIMVAIHLPQYIRDAKAAVLPAEFVKVDKALIFFNVVSFVSMIGVSLTLFFTIYFFRKIRKNFELKS